jgi:hypothetical protein
VAVTPLVTGIRRDTADLRRRTPELLGDLMSGAMPERAQRPIVTSPPLPPHPVIINLEHEVRVVSACNDLTCVNRRNDRRRVVPTALAVRLRRVVRQPTWRYFPGSASIRYEV